MTTPNIGMPFLAVGQAQKEVTHNEALIALDAVVQLSVLSIRSEPPPTPQNGERWIVGAAASGEWTDKEGRIALWYSGWRFFDPLPGWLAWVANEAAFRTFDGSGWGGLAILSTTIAGDISAAGLPTTSPAPGSGRLWVDGDVVKRA